MNKINSLENSSLKTELENGRKNKDENKINQSNIKDEKVLCNHCGRTTSNGIRCIGICVSDNEY